jgi:predicted DNA-binding protein (MmcQ/YjbR family)
MLIDEFHQFCLSLPNVTEGFPFGGTTLVFKVKNKMFALCDVNEFNSINLKCEPLKALELREQYEAVTPGYHMNKKHWNTILMNSNLPDKLVQQWIIDSYTLVVASLPKAERFDISNLKQIEK